jgi:3-isopropylmalate/(R)-2-methylmalate dehydratase small subunit
VRKLPMVPGGSGPRFVRHTGIVAPFPSGESEDRDFVLDQEPYRDASILLAGESFGTGRAAESEVFRLMAYGIRSVIAPGFGQVFCSNCLTVGMLPVTLSEEVIEEIADRVGSDSGVEVTVDLEGQVIEVPGMGPISFSMDDRARTKLLQGLNDLDEMRQHVENVVAFRDHDRNRRPWVYDLRDPEEVPPPVNLTSQGDEGGGGEA